MITSIDATEDVDEAVVEEIAEAAVVVVGEVDGVATETVLVGAAELEVWIENESSAAETGAFALCLTNRSFALWWIMMRMG